MPALSREHRIEDRFSPNVGVVLHHRNTQNSGMGKEPSPNSMRLSQSIVDQHIVIAQLHNILLITTKRSTPPPRGKTEKKSRT